MSFEKLGVKVPNIMLPNQNIDLTKWTVVACDQYSSEPDYWEETASITANNPSALNLIFPECYLEEDDADERIAKINSTMEQYIKNDIFSELDEGFILIDRKTAYQPSRKGLVVALDLEKYDYNKTAKTLIRATEGTLLDRLPPRIKIRENAPVELPHIMVLIDDPEKTVIEPLFKKNLETVYDFELMQNGGHIKGFKVDQAEDLKHIEDGLSKLAEPDIFNKKYGLDSQEVLLFAMGDGNHSFATAKAIWEKIKQETSDFAEIENHPARYALVELVNIHDEGLVFEPIHRVMFGAEKETTLSEFAEFAKQKGWNFKLDKCADRAAWDAICANISKSKEHVFPYVTKDEYGVITISDSSFNLDYATLQEFINFFDETHKEATVDYIHGTESLVTLSSKDNSIGFFCSTLDKNELFKTIIIDGSLVRKTFSMGEADEKRFYLEARKII